MRREILEICFYRTLSSGTHTSKSVKRGMAMANCKQSPPCLLPDVHQWIKIHALLTTIILFTKIVSHVSWMITGQEANQSMLLPYCFSWCSPNQIKYTPSLQQSSFSQKACTHQFTVSRITGQEANQNNAPASSFSLHHSVGRPHHQHFTPHPIF
jgi:hypothetical protein